MMRNEEHGFKEIIVSFKQIYVNTYNINVFDARNQSIVFRHESFQLWESTVSGLLTEFYDFVILSKQGLSVLSLDDQANKEFLDKDGKNVKLHSLESINYLKVERTNCINLIETGD